MTGIGNDLVDSLRVDGWVCERSVHVRGTHSGDDEFTAQFLDGIGHVRQMIVSRDVLWLVGERGIGPSNACLAKKAVGDMYPFEIDNVFDGTEVRLAGTSSHIEVTLGQTDSNATNVVGNVKLELIAHGSVEWRKEQLADWRVQDLVRKVAIWVDPLNSVAIMLSALCMALYHPMTYATVLPSIAMCIARTVWYPLTNLGEDRIGLVHE